MADNRVIQDSDDSYCDISDSAPSIDPLQDASSAGPLSSKRVGTDDNEGRYAGRSERQPLDIGEYNRRDDDDVKVDFDNFLVSQSRDSQHVGASQRVQEELWLGGPANGAHGK